MNLIKEIIKEKVLVKYPDNKIYLDKTDNILNYLDKNLELVLEAYNLDLLEGSDRHTKMMISNHYAGNKRQTKNIRLQTELWMHEELFNLFCKQNKFNNVEKLHLASLFDLWKTTFEKNSADHSYLDNLTLNRTSFSKFENTEIDQITKNQILNAANGITPSLANNYHYRVDVLPNEVKELMWPYMHSKFDDCPQEVQDAFEKNHLAHTMDEWRDKGICFNHQFNAPLVLAFSMPKFINDPSKPWTRQEFPTSKDATFIALGTNMWNVICKVEELGLNSCCLKAYNPKALEQIEVHTNEVMPNGWKWEPFIFLCIGKGIQAKGDHRKYKPNGIVNSLKFLAKQ
jgi:predicted oxidoreductase (fatty acid repression mutant protein)